MTRSTPPACSTGAQRAAIAPSRSSSPRPGTQPMPNGARRRMETADARSVELLRQDYLPLAQTHGVPAVRDGAGGPWVKALSNFFLIKANQHLEAIRSEE